MSWVTGIFVCVFSSGAAFGIGILENWPWLWGLGVLGYIGSMIIAETTA